MKQLYFPLIIEASEFRAVLHSNVYNTDLVAVEGLTARKAVEQAKSTIPDLNKSFNDDFTISRVEQLVLVSGEKEYRTVPMQS